MASCNFCKIEFNDLKKCQRCLNASYCGKKCQTADWKAHKRVCGKSKEDLFEEQRKRDNANTNELELIDQMMKNMILSNPKVPNSAEYRKIVQVYAQTPCLVTLFKKLMKGKKYSAPFAANATKLLESATMQNRTIWMTEMCILKESHTSPFLQSPGNLIKMLGTPDEKKLKWFFNSSLGDVYISESTSPYDSSVYHSFSNACLKRQVLETGHVHVAIGFVDLSALLSIDLVDGGTAEPLRFIGYEMSPFNVAKTKVIAAMLSLPQNQHLIDAIIQVWYSSCWSEETLKLFQTALIQAKEGCVDPQVLELLNLWSNGKPVSVETAHEEWLKKIDESSFDPVVNCLQEHHRETLLHYFLTGEIMESSVGSVTMFCLPPTLNGRSRNESCFHSVTLKDLADYTREHGDFVVAITEIFRDRIGRLKNDIDQNRISIEIKPPAVVSLENKDVISEIQSLEPYTISWNNCLDYMTVKDFHLLARFCSASENTVHYAYSMNWRTNVRGSFSMSLGVGKHMRRLLDSGRNAIQMQSLFEGTRPLLRSIPIDNPFNVMDTVCGFNVHRYWIDKFFNSKTNVGVTCPVESYNIFARSSMNLSLTWSYDMDINFNVFQPTFG
jgi:hypothetical protein